MDGKVIIALTLIACVSGLKVLVLSPMPIRSLNILGVGYVRHLLNAGHEVTYVSPYPLKDKPITNFTQIDLSSTNINLLAGDYSLNLAYLIRQPQTEDAEIEHLQANSMEVAEATFQNKKIQAMLNDPSVTFDVVICDLIESEMYQALAAYYECPMIWAYSLGTHWLTLRLIDEATNPAYAFDYLSSGIPPFHSMSQRVKKLWVLMQWYYYKWFKTLPQEKAVYQNVFAPLFLKKNKPLPYYYEIINNASFVLSNDFVGNGPITSVPQNFKFIGGYHVETPTKPLSYELQAMLDKAEHGFIYVSMGSTWKSKDIPEHITKGLLDVFSRLKQTVIWKYEEVLTNLPRNVHIVPWAPQQSILAHPKCLFFITHGGLLSTIESVHYGVPTIGIPIYFDQFINVNRAAQFGSTIKVSLTLNLIEDLKMAVQKMLRDPIYKQRAIEMSQIYHDRLVPPSQKLVHWVEHVVKTRGAPHLRSPASLMPWWEKTYFDVILLVLVIVLVGYISGKYLCGVIVNIRSHRKVD